jgi:hypothetical protein
MHRRPRRERRVNAAPDLDRLHRLQRHHGRCQQCIQALVPLRIRAQSGRNMVRHHLKHSAYGIARAQNFIDFLFHALLDLGVRATEQDFILARNFLDLLPRDFPLAQGNTAHGDDVTQDFNVQLAQKQLGQRADRNSRCRFARRRPLQHVARFCEIVLQRSCQIGVPRTR